MITASILSDLIPCAPEKAQENDAVFVARFVLVRLDPPVLEQRFALENADGHGRVPDIEGQ